MQRDIIDPPWFTIADIKYPVGKESSYIQPIQRYASIRQNARSSTNLVFGVLEWRNARWHFWGEETAFPRVLSLTQWLLQLVKTTLQLLHTQMVKFRRYNFRAPILCQNRTTTMTRMARRKERIFHLNLGCR